MGWRVMHQRNAPQVPGKTLSGTWVKTRAVMKTGATKKCVCVCCPVRCPLYLPWSPVFLGIQSLGLYHSSVEHRCACRCDNWGALA